MKMTHLKPSLIHRSIHEIDFEALWGRGIRYLCFDIENTLGLMECTEFEPETDKLLRDLLSMGFKLAFATNSLGPYRALAAQYGAVLCQPNRRRFRRKSPRKPQRGFYKKLLGLLGDPSRLTVAMVGDKLTADVQAAEAYGLTGILVNPLGPDLRIEDRLHFRQRENRRLERLGIRRAI